MLLRRTRLLAVLALLAAASLVPFEAHPAAAASTYAAICPVNLRTSPSTSGSTAALIQSGSLVAVSGSVSGDAWSASCPGPLAGSSWFMITAVNGRSTSSLYGASAVYGAAGLFRLGGYLEGVDVSTYQGTVAWSSVAAVGKRFAIMRSSLGSTYRDPTYPTNHAGARAVGIAVGAYHYATPSSDPADPVNEANWFVQNAALAVGDVFPALDVEQTGGLGPSALQGWVQAWLDRVYTLTGLRPMIYSSPSFWQNAMGNTAAFANEGYSVLWVAHWDAASPSVPAASWGGHGWTFWQYDNCGNVSGIAGCVDLDRYNGTDLSPVIIRSIVDGTQASETPTTPSLSITPSASTISVGQLVTLGISFAPAGAGRTIALQQIPAGQTVWTELATATADGSGNAAFTVAPQTNTQFRTVFAGSSDLGPTASRVIRVLVRSTIGLAPTNSGRVASLAYGSRRTFAATVRPIGPGIAPQLVSFRFYRYIGGRWVFLTKRDAWADATGRASYAWTFTWRGQWYVRAVANSTSTNANSYGSNLVRYSVR